MPSVDQITERFAGSMAKQNQAVQGDSCLNCRHSRKLKTSKPGEMVCQLDDCTVKTNACCVAWAALFQTGGF